MGYDLTDKDIERMEMMVKRVGKETEVVLLGEYVEKEEGEEVE